MGEEVLEGDPVEGCGGGGMLAGGGLFGGDFRDLSALADVLDADAAAHDPVTGRFQ